jgi:hypothetical protein
VDDAPITGTPSAATPSTALARRKYVPSREVAPGQVIVIDPAPQQPPPPNSPALEELKDPESPPALDPTRIGLNRPYRHRVRYRLAQLTTVLSVALTIATIIVLTNSDRWLAIIIAAAALIAGFVAIYLGQRSRLASRIVGYSIAACALAALATVLTLALPGHLFEERHPEQLPPNIDTRPSKPA